MRWQKIDRARVAAVLAADADLEARLHAAALLDRDLHQLADAVLVDASRTDRRRARRCRRTRGRKRPESSRERPKPICVRSLVPNEKKSAWRAISSAISAARGTSIIVPTVYASFFFVVREHCFGGVVDERAQPLQLADSVATSGIMISGCTLTPLPATSTRGLDDRAHLHRVDLGIGDRQPAAAVAEHRVELVQRFAGLLELSAF